MRQATPLRHVESIALVKSTNGVQFAFRSVAQCRR